MNAFSKKILSAFIDISNTEPFEKVMTQPQGTTSVNVPSVSASSEADTRFADHFDKLFADANLPGPDYYEFSKMIAVMQGLNDGKSRYCTAFAGLQVQGMDKQKLLASIHQYLQLLDDDATDFQSTVSAAFEDKVGSKREAVEEAKKTVQQLSQQIIALQGQIAQWTTEITENEAKIQQRNSGYNSAMQTCKKRLSLDIEKINQYII